MHKLQFNNELEFAAEPYKGKLRLVVYQNRAQFVCETETIKKIEIFLKAKVARIFKGRLQLRKINRKIDVEVKGNKIGSIIPQQLNQ